MATTKNKMNILVSYMCENEMYHGTKNKKKPQVSRADMKEIVGIMSDLVVKQPEAISLLIQNGLKRQAKRKK